MNEAYAKVCSFCGAPLEDIEKEKPSKDKTNAKMEDYAEYVDILLEISKKHLDAAVKEDKSNFKKDSDTVVKEDKSNFKKDSDTVVKEDKSNLKKTFLILLAGGHYTLFIIMIFFMFYAIMGTIMGRVKNVSISVSIVIIICTAGLYISDYKKQIGILIMIISILGILYNLFMALTTSFAIAHLFTAIISAIFLILVFKRDKK